MLDWNELLIIGAAALVFIGPKELPGALRTMGKFVAKARTMAREFQTNVDDMVREAELDEVKKQVQKLEYGGLERMVKETVDPKGQLSKALEAPDLGMPNLNAPSLSSPSLSSPSLSSPSLSAPGLGEPGASGAAPSAPPAAAAPVAAAPTAEATASASKA